MATTLTIIELFYYIYSLQSMGGVIGGSGKRVLLTFVGKSILTPSVLRRLRIRELVVFLVYNIALKID